MRVSNAEARFVAGHRDNDPDGDDPAWRWQIRTMRRSEILDVGLIVASLYWCGACIGVRTV